MSFQRLAVFDFYRTGQQDCANMFGKDEVRDALREHPRYDDRRLLADILENVYAVGDPETKQRWLADQDFEGLDPEKCWTAYQRGWADQALGYIRAWRPGLIAESAERENPDPKDATMFKHRTNPRHGRPQKTYTVVRVNRDNADTYAVEGSDASARARALEISGADPGDQVEYAVVQATDAGAARLQGRGWRPFPGGAVENPRDQTREAILGGMASALWVTSWASYCEELSPARQAKLREEGLIPGGGGDWADAAPSTPPTAQLAAKRLAQAFEERNGVTIQKLFERAMEADGGVGTSKKADLFGHYLAMQALGNGVSWFDDHAQFPLEFPFYTEANYDGRRLHVSIRGV